MYLRKKVTYFFLRNLSTFYSTELEVAAVIICDVAESLMDDERNAGSQPSEADNVR
jgi:hypothetical protein